MEQAELTVRSGLGRSYVYAEPGYARADSSSRQVQFRDPPVAQMPGVIKTDVVTHVPTGTSAATVKTEPPGDEYIMSMSSDVHDQGMRLQQLQHGFDQYTKQLEKTEERWKQEFGHLKQLILTSAARGGQLSSYSQASGLCLPMQPKTGTPMLGNMGQSPPKCFMCSKYGHISMDCEWQKKFVNDEWLHFDKQKGRMVLKDGTGLPAQLDDDNEPRYEKIEHIARERGWTSDSGQGSEDPSAVMYWTEEPEVEPSYFQDNLDEVDPDKLILDEMDERILRAYVLSKREAMQEAKESKN
ncbi:hypothetical protein L218DRAFT_1009903 [Marasmius fiardii PR-910]|nr:hypothetical protein L218DRAFT_1009903 [Marasmius fiardii PR-910]